MTIKTQDGKVITKDGKVSCDCCNCIYTEEEWQSATASSPANVFEITKEEFDQYYNGGTWQVDTQWIAREVVTSNTPNCVSDSTDSGSINAFAEGCNHFVEGIVSASVTYSGPCSGDFTAYYTFPFYIKLRIGRVGPKLYAHFIALSNVSDSDMTSTTAIYPGTVTFTVDGNSLLAFGTWFPGWEGYSGYSNNSSITLTATFTPSA
jgi:hypothetical protein